MALALRIENCNTAAHARILRVHVVGVWGHDDVHELDKRCSRRYLSQHRGWRGCSGAATWLRRLHRQLLLQLLF